MKKVIAVLIFTVVILAGCGSTADSETQKVGIAMPTKSAQRWIQDGDNLKAQLEEDGYEVDLQYAQDDTSVQASQIENMIAGGVDCLVVAPVDGTALTEPLQQAKDAGIPVISYDRLLMNTDAVSYYLTFDNYNVGVLQAQYIIDTLGLDLNDTSKTYTMEIFAGSLTDNNSPFFFDGAMDTLKPYIDAGIITIPSGQDTLKECAIPDWSGQKAQERMDNLYAANYADGTHLDIVLSQYDPFSTGVISSLKASGYTDDDLPIITGQDADKEGVKQIIAGEQSMSVYKDTRALAQKTVEVVDAVLKGEEVEVNNTTDYDNGNGVVNTITLDPQVVDQGNYQELLIDSGYYTEEDLGLN